MTVTLKQAVFGDDYIESESSIIIPKSHINFLTVQETNTAQSLLFGLLNNLYSFQSQSQVSSNIKYSFSSTTFNNGRITYTFWFQIFDQPLDGWGWIDLSQPIIISKL